ncbi:MULTISPECIES: isocitrate/isopropylmalate family dehydrogenase [Actinoalloteichus]|uniref:Isocitrate/isopropylmalate dehydrogenase n=1 Tax=Actinoalloteichus fjordicus TaxID=1612552 RepID=A0AAC9LDC7_9PSEU|nr:MULTISPECIES: isocitrate/isopropylmalate family dehydrogenase [Actinoalloteichus]APU15556.1 Isocitrate/isopropylmalate dehydrogenase [Actinoalloteichus fjordicus]APU21623.1 Isocitrate/isopropylmalate dehydrogenase [Actinoalloteichus sp. GBA129-24]
MQRNIGLAVGRGTGPELADVFERTVQNIGQLYSTTAVITRSPRIYHSYFSLLPEGDLERIRQLTEEDAAHYEQFCRDQAVSGTSAIFRTAMNAQSLYLVRQRLRAVKVDVIQAQKASLLLIRDAAQGFYTGENSHVPGVVTRTMTFSREITDQVISFALRRARDEWPDGEVREIIMAYKFHLLDGAFAEWVADAAARHGVDIALCQPDTVNRNLIERGLSPRTVIISGNEWADIMHAVLLDRFAAERQESRFTENIHLHPEVSGLVEYQTVHGSADDLAGTNRVNPMATVRAAAAVMERHVHCTGATKAMELALDSLRSREILTSDLGGSHSTTAVVDALLDVLEPHVAPAADTGPADPSAAP